MSRIWRLLRAEQGVALIAVMMAIFVLTIVVAAMAIATMGESNLSFNQLRGQQALSVAEAGAYRALAELRRRLSIDLDAQISTESSSSPTLTSQNVYDICNRTPPHQWVEIITNYAYPNTRDWVQTGDLATLSVGSASSRIQMTDQGSGQAIGDFYATIAVRPSGAAAICDAVSQLDFSRGVMWFDYAIMAVGRSGNATRTVCLRSDLADRCPNWFPTPSAGWQGSFTRFGSSGWPVLIERPSYSTRAIALLSGGSVWLYTGTTINGPIHSNSTFNIAGDPVIGDVVTQVNTQMQFYNCGSPTNITIPGSNPNATLSTACDNVGRNTFRSLVTGGVAPIPIPSNANPSRISTGLSPTGANATDAQVQANTTDPEALVSPAPVPNGLYVMNNCAPAGCGGIYVKGDVQQVVLTSENGMQAMSLTIQSDPNPLRRNMKVIVDPVSKAVTTCWGFVGPDPGAGNCSGWASSRSYPAGTFNGVFYVNGSITTDPNPAASTGLYGVVNQYMRLTIATENELRIADQLVYERPPAGPGDNPANVLGLYSVTGNVTVAGSLTPNDLYIDAAVLAPTGQFWVEGWNTLAPKGSVYFTGGSVQSTFGAFGGFSPSTGYGRIMTYDWRLRSNVSPPSFPRLPFYAANRYPSLDQVFTYGDMLYNRPLWEEMVGL